MQRLFRLCLLRFTNNDSSASPTARATYASTSDWVCRRLLNDDHYCQVRLFQRDVLRMHGLRAGEHGSADNHNSTTYNHNSCYDNYTRSNHDSPSPPSHHDNTYHHNHSALRVLVLVLSECDALRHHTDIILCRLCVVLL